MKLSEHHSQVAPLAAAATAGTRLPAAHAVGIATATAEMPADPVSLEALIADLSRRTYTPPALLRAALVVVALEDAVLVRLGRQFQSDSVSKVLAFKAIELIRREEKR